MFIGLNSKGGTRNTRSLNPVEESLVAVAKGQTYLFCENNY